MHPLLRRLQGEPGFRAMLAALGAPSWSAHADGLAPAARPLLVAALHLVTRRTLLVLAPGDDAADQFHQAISACLPEGRVRFFPSIESTLYERYGADAEAAADRLRVLGELVSGRAGVVVASGTALMTDLLPKRRFAELTRRVAAGDVLDRDALVEWLVESGYKRADMVAGPGEFAARGCIVDAYPPTLPAPLRVEFFGDNVDSIRAFDPGTQRSTGTTAVAWLVPARETVPSNAQRRMAADRLEEIRAARRGVLEPEARKRLAEVVAEDAEALRLGRYFGHIDYYHQLLFDDRESLLGYLSDDAVLVVNEPHRMLRACDELAESLAETEGHRLSRGELPSLPEPVFRGADGVASMLGQRQAVYLTMLAPALHWTTHCKLVEFECPPVDSFRGSTKDLCDQVTDWQLGGMSVVLSTSQQKRLKAILAEHGVEHVEDYADGSDLGSGIVHVGRLAAVAGFVLPGCRLAVVTDRELFGWHRPVLPPRRPRSEVRLTSLAELGEGDFVVHLAHGVGRYVGIVQDTVDGVERDYLRIEYEDGTLKVPTTQIDRVQKYLGADDAVPKLDTLAGTAWKRKRSRAEKATQEVAKELLRLYAERETATGFAFSPDQPWQLEMEAAFVYDETPDQLEAIVAAKSDMESVRPMDRLICGDVGFGKTEVAVRAAFKCVLDGKQVAVLVPTTILCEQHWRTFCERLGAYPVRVDRLSRFSSPEDTRAVLRGIESGATDIVVGTHRLLSRDVRFASLGLLVVDEEHRFGVKHKESLRAVRANVDALTLTATPIPRTLNMALSGIRELSTMQQAPRGRVPIRTFCVEEEDDVIREAIRRELAREGQVYFVHNRVQSIGGWARRLKKLVPEARIAIGHGQMSDDDLERVMLDFYAGDYDILCCTSIIESGLDVPNVNTLIVQNAPMLGLAQLYQLRGRVGRSTRQAYAYFLYTNPAILTHEAEQRLSAMKEFTELGSGIRVAMRDLEIRGAGNLLGAEQHGHIEAVGFELYCQMLREAVSRLRGEAGPPSEELPAVDLPVNAFLPGDYVPSEGHRLDIYRRLATVRDLERLGDMRQELEDRFGPLPDEAAQLLRVIRFRILCADRDIVATPEEAGAIQLRLRPGRMLTKASQARLRKLWLLGARRTLRTLVVKDLWITVVFANISADAKLEVLEELAGYIETEKRQARP